MRLGLGELEETNEYSREFTRIRFLVVAEKLEPKILREAREGPLVLFQEFASSIPDAERDVFWTGINDATNTLEQSPGTEAFFQSLGDWARRWNLDSEWCVERTIMAFRRYFDGKERGVKGDLSWFYPLYTFLPDDAGNKPYLDKIDQIFENPILAVENVFDYKRLSLPPPPPQLPDWDPKTYPLKEGYLARAEWEARRRLEADPYLSLVERSHREAYVKLVKEQVSEYAELVMAQAQSQAELKKVKVKPKLKAHLEWTIRVWVLNENFRRVARSLEPKLNEKRLTGKAVKKAVKEILELIEPSWSARLEERFPSGRPPEE